MVAYASSIVEDDILATYNEAFQSLKNEKWKKAMNEEMQSFQKNETLRLASLLKGNKAIGCK